MVGDEAVIASIVKCKLWGANLRSEKLEGKERVRRNKPWRGKKWRVEKRGVRNNGGGTMKCKRGTSVIVKGNMCAGIEWPWKPYSCWGYELLVDWVSSDPLPGEVQPNTTTESEKVGCMEALGVRVSGVEIEPGGRYKSKGGMEQTWPSDDADGNAQGGGGWCWPRMVRKWFRWGVHGVPGIVEWSEVGADNGIGTAGAEGEGEGNGVGEGGKGINRNWEMGEVRVKGWPATLMNEA
ncbi:hypothetical protein Tco_1491313 [Tanacetum coccineum]